MNQLTQEIQNIIQEEAEKSYMENVYPVIKTFFGEEEFVTSYTFGATKWALEAEYWKKRCEAAESRMNVMDIPMNKADSINNYYFLEFRKRNDEWQKSIER